MINPNTHPLFSAPRIFLTKDKNHRWFMWVAQSPPLRGHSVWYVRGQRHNERGANMAVTEEQEDLGIDMPWETCLWEHNTERWVQIEGRDGTRE